MENQSMLKKRPTATVENHMQVLLKTKIKLPYNPAIALLGIYPEKTIIQKDTYTSMFTSALFTTARTSEAT